MASWWMIGSRFPLLILPLSIYPFDGEKRCYFLFRLFGIFFLSLSVWFGLVIYVFIYNRDRESIPPTSLYRTSGGHVTRNPIFFVCFGFPATLGRRTGLNRCIVWCPKQSLNGPVFFPSSFLAVCLLKTRWWQWWSDEQGPIYCGL